MIFDYSSLYSYYLIQCLIFIYRNVFGIILIVNNETSVFKITEIICKMILPVCFILILYKIFIKNKFIIFYWVHKLILSFRIKTVLLLTQIRILFYNLRIIVNTIKFIWSLWSFLIPYYSNLHSRQNIWYVKHKGKTLFTLIWLRNIS